MIWRLRGARLRRAASHSACSAARRPTGAATSFRAVASAPHPSARAPTRFRQAAPNALARAPKIRRGAPIQPAFLQRLLVGGQGRATAAPFHQDCFLPLASSKRFLNVDRVRARLMRAVIGETKANRPPRRPPATAGGILRPGNSDPQAGRRRDLRQSRLAQGKSGATGHPNRWRAALVPAEILARPQSDRVSAQFKTLLRKAGARTYEAISDAAKAILARYPPQECAAYLRNAGYA